MSRGIRTLALAAGAAAIISAQAAYAAPVQGRSAAIDPLVTLSVLGTKQSRAAVCTSGAGTTCLASVPLSGASLTAATAAAAAAQGDPEPPKAFGIWPVAIGIAVLLAIILVVASGDGDDEGNLTPVSPA